MLPPHSRASFTAPIPAQWLNHPMIWRGASTLAEAQVPAIATGFAALDRELPGGGWPAAGLSELLCDAAGAGEVSLLLPALAACARRPGEGRGIVWIAPPYLPYAPALAAAGVELKKLLIVRSVTPADAWWAAEQAMRCGAAAMVVLWACGGFDAHGATRARIGSKNEYTLLRRLQLACASAQCAGFVYRTSNAAQQASPAPLRIALQCRPQATQDLLELRILKRRGLGAAQPLYLQRELRGLNPASVLQRAAQASRHTAQAHPQAL